jgi:N-acetylmuramoyl-L-alanine amidase
MKPLSDRARKIRNFRKPAILILCLGFAFLFLFLARLAALVVLPARDLPPLPSPSYPDDFGVKTVMLDPGHGGDNEGTKAFWGLREKKRNLDIVKALRKKLEASGHWRVFQTRDADVAVVNSNRPQIANESGADVYISIHCNGSNDSLRGFSVIWYPAQNLAASEKLAVILAGHIRDAGFPMDMMMGTMFTQSYGPDAGPDYQRTEHEAPVYIREKTDHRMIYPARMPGVLIETHYMTDAVEALRFTIDEYVERFCAAVEIGLVDFFVKTGGVDKTTEPLP